MAHRNGKKLSSSQAQLAGPGIMLSFFPFPTGHPAAAHGALAFVDIKTKAPTQYSLLLLKCNSQFYVNKI